MKNTKKGFTLVELLVVIAIVAILATVAIIGYTSFTRKADISNDTVIAKELTTLIQATDINDSVEDFDDVMSVLYANGFYLANLNTKTEGCFFVWESKNNQILLVDAKNGFEVLFPESYEPKGATWHLICSDKDLLTGLDLGDIQVVRAVSSIESLQEFIAEGGEVYLDSSVVLNAGNTIKINDKNADIVLNLGGNSLSTNGTITSVPVEIIAGNLTVNDAVIGGSGTFENENGSFATAVGFDGINAPRLILNNCEITGVGNAVAGANYEDGPAYVEVNNCTLSSNNVGFQASSATVVLNNTNINCPNPIFATFGANVTINSGNYVSTTDCMFEMHDNSNGATKVTVNGGNFTFNDLVIWNGSTTIVINGGTFNNVDYLEFFETYDAADTNVSIEGNVVTLTKK